ncbi:GNAT family N-acetyltransferase [Streptomyces sp. NBC_01276]|uniref:GNAT family N-acetyltransferase n=1 Tax=Streptomyces sp. NBC_01276 TaxID=2903808 RepID=UPI002F90FE96
MRPEHAGQVLAVYRLGIDDGNATFETSVPTWEAFDAAKLPEHRLVALDGAGRVLGWAAVVRVSDRCAYAGVVEHSVHVHPDARGRGVGLALLDDRRADAHSRSPARVRQTDAVQRRVHEPLQIGPARALR